MKPGLHIVISVCLFSLLYPFVGSAQQAFLKIKEIEIVENGDFKLRDRLQDIKNFVAFVEADTMRPVDRKEIFAGESIWVNAGAKLHLGYKNQEAWCKSETLINVNQDTVIIIPGENLIIGHGGSIITRKLMPILLSECYMKVEVDGKTILYVVKGKVIVRDETGQERILSKSMAIDESLSDIELPAEEISRILIWSDHVKRLHGFGQWFKRHWWTAAVGVAACVVVNQILPNDQLEPTSAPRTPFYFRPIHDSFPTLTINLDYGIGLKAIRNLQLLGGRASVEANKWRASLGIWNLIFNERNDELTIMGSVAYNIFSPLKLFAADAQLGVGFSKLANDNTTTLQQWDIPIGVGIGVNVGLPFVARFEPWLAPRLHIRCSKLNDSGEDDDGLRGGVGVSTGLNILLPFGFGGHMAFEWLRIKDSTNKDAMESEQLNEFTFGMGIQWRW